jgi:hypothetical protein
VAILERKPDLLRTSGAGLAITHQAKENNPKLTPMAHTTGETQKLLARLACTAKSGQRRNQSRGGCVIREETSVTDPIHCSGVWGGIAGKKS